MRAIILARTLSSDPAREARRGRDSRRLAAEVKELGRELGFAKVGVAGVDLDSRRATPRRMARGRPPRRDGLHGAARAQAHAASRAGPGTVRVISARMDYWPRGSRDARERARATLDAATSRATRSAATITRCCAARLPRLARAIEKRAGARGYRVFVDSAPVLEKALARNAGLGWIGKHTNLLDREAGSWFLLGELYTICRCRSTRRSPSTAGRAALASTFARRERSSRRTSSTPAAASRISRSSCAARSRLELRAAIGNRIFGCDDCQLFCPWNKFARPTERRRLRGPSWSRRHGARAAVRVDRIGMARAPPGRRCAAPATKAGCATSRSRSATRPTDRRVVAALRPRSEHPSPIVREHVHWALGRHAERRADDRLRSARSRRCSKRASSLPRSVQGQVRYRRLPDGAPQGRQGLRVEARKGGRRARRLATEALLARPTTRC